MFSVMWTSTAPTSARGRCCGPCHEGEDVVAGIGEQAGVIAIGDGLAVAFQIESHNHPSAVEPYQGAATGVGGILRDIFAMGARPDRGARRAALRRSVGRPHAPPRSTASCAARRLRQLRRRAHRGRRARLDPSYQGNPLVNVMAIGLLGDGMLMHASRRRPGNLVVLYGSATGRDGIGGASVLAARPSADRTRPSVRRSRWATPSPRSS